jgi:hypothetical protein
VGVDSPSDDGEPVPKTMQGTPTLLLIDRAGHLRRQTFGHVSDLELEAAVAELMAAVNQLERGFMPDRVVPRFLTIWKAVNGTADSFVDSIEVRCVDGVGVKNLRGIGRFAATVQATRPPVF